MNIVVLLAVIVVVYVVFQSRLAKRRQRFLRDCIANMQVVEDAKDAFQDDRGLPNGRAVLATQLIPYLEKSCNFRCPEKPVEYEIGKLGQFPECALHGTLDEPHLPGKGR